MKVKLTRPNQNSKIVWIKFVPQDLWIGLYWKKTIYLLGLTGGGESRQDQIVTTWYLCLIPCFPIIWETVKNCKIDRIKLTDRNE